MLAKTESVALIGTEARLIEVEVHVPGTGLPAFRIVGLPNKSVVEAEQRVRAALTSSEMRWPPSRITANLAPGELRKEGAHFDLAIALGVLAADKRLPPETLKGWVTVGELSLDGAVKPVRGALAAAIACREHGRRGVICPTANASEVGVVDDIEVVPVDTFVHCVDFLKGQWTPPPIAMIEDDRSPEAALDDISDVRGHEAAKRALEIAATGGHNLLLNGPPGSGKTMLAQRLPGILPDMSVEEAMEVTRVYSVAGLLGERASLIKSRPFRAPHQHVSTAGLIGGGSGLARPGEISLAHHGVLFLDEVSLFKRDVLDSLRAPLEDGVIRLARSGGVVAYPARFSLIAATNPCPCGFARDKKRACTCSPIQRMAHKAKMSGPLMDRIDIQIQMPRLDREQLMGSPEGERSVDVRKRVVKVRLIQAERYGSATKTNASVSRPELDAAIDLTPTATHAIADAIDRLLLTGRGMTRTLRLARTLADLDDVARVKSDHVVRALSLRLLSSEEDDDE